MQPLLTFGVIADVQYADIDDGQNYKRTRHRYYRDALKKVRTAVDAWRGDSSSVSFIIQLGDIIDGHNKRHKRSHQALGEVLEVLQTINRPVHHLIGNHELYNFLRDELGKTELFRRWEAIRRDSDTIYYDFSPYPGIRIFLLDCYDVAMLGRLPGTTEFALADQLLTTHNPNEDKNSPEGLNDIKRRYCMFNGGIGEAQLQWLDHGLEASARQKENVIVCGHIPVHPESASNECLLWNFKDVLQLFDRHRCVLAYLCGHDHDGGYHRDASGTHHLTFPGVIETPPQENAFATVDVYEDRLRLRGTGRVPDLEMSFPVKLTMR